MILIFGGTTEGRTAAETLDEAGNPFIIPHVAPFRKSRAEI